MSGFSLVGFALHHTHTPTRSPAQLFTHPFLALIHTYTHTKPRSLPVEMTFRLFPHKKTLSPAEKQTVHLSGYQIAKAEIDFTYNSHVHLVHFNTVYSQKTMHFLFCLAFFFFFGNVLWNQQSVPPQIRTEVHADDAHNNVFAGLFCSSARFPLLP